MDCIQEKFNQYILPWLLFFIVINAVDGCLVYQATVLKDGAISAYGTGACINMIIGIIWTFLTPSVRRLTGMYISCLMCSNMPLFFALSIFGGTGTIHYILKLKGL